MEYAGCEIANPNNKHILRVINVERDCDRFNNRQLSDEKLNNPENSHDRAYKSAVLDLGKSAIYLVNSDTAKNNLLFARVIVRTNDEKILVSKSSDPRFDEAINREVQIATDKEIVSLHCEIKENIVDGLSDIGVEENDIKKIDFELLEDSSNEFFVAEVNTSLTEDEIVNRLSDDDRTSPELTASDFVFKDDKAIVEISEELMADSDDAQGGVITESIIKVIRYVKKRINLHK